MEPVTVTKENFENSQGDYMPYMQDGDENMYILSAGLPLIKLLLKKGSRFIPYEEGERIFPSMFGWGRDVSYHLKKFTNKAEEVTNDFLGQVRMNPNLFIRFRIEAPSGVHKDDSYLLNEFHKYLQLLNKKNIRLRTLNDKLFKSNMKIVSIQNIFEIQYQQSFDALWCFLYDKRVKAYVVCLLTSKDENNNDIGPIPSQRVVQVWKQTPNTDTPPERVEFLKRPYGYARIRYLDDYDVSNAQKSYIYKIDIDNLHTLSTLVRNDDDENFIDKMEKILGLFADLRPFTNFGFIRKLTAIETDGDDIDRATFLPLSNVVFTICSKFKGLYDALKGQDKPVDLHEFDTRMNNYADEDTPGGYATAYTRRCIDFVTPTDQKIAALKQSKHAFIMVKNGLGDFGEYDMYSAENDIPLLEDEFKKITKFYEQIKQIHLQETGFGLLKAKTRNAWRTIKSAIPYFVEDPYPDPVIYMINQTRNGVPAPSSMANNNLLLVAMLLQVQVWQEEFGEFG